ncbi:DNA replication complex GINS protein psf2 [Chytriomyces sp. MP71]|nr:DNA replication complex GINS protein psf2 [Chytriomyces sp. MP71]
MALPAELRTALSPQEVEFLAENQHITIVPTRALPDKFELLSGEFGPFRPPLKSTVPLWLALSLKKRGKCTVVVPEWIDAEYLEHKLEEERSLHDTFAELPSAWFETANLLMRHVKDDIVHFETVCSLIKSIKETRANKAVSLLKNIDIDLYSKRGYLELDHLGFAEINEIKPFFTRAFDEMGKFSGMLTKEADGMRQ